MEFISYLKSLISGMKTKEALQKTTDLLAASAPDLETTAIILSAQYNQLKTQEFDGIISKDEFYQQLNKINKSLLGLIEEINEDIELYKPYIDEAANEVIKADRQRKSILFLASNPESDNLDLSKELQDISNKLSLIDKRGYFDFRAKVDLRKKDFQRAILELENEPKFIHFAGSGAYKEEGSLDGLKLFDNQYKSVSVLAPDLMAQILKKFSSLECLFLNACNTTPLAMGLANHIPYMVTMDHYVSDRLAIYFATSFYEALGSGKSIEFAFSYSLDNLALDGSFSSTELATPRLIVKGQPIDYRWHGLRFEEWESLIANEKKDMV